MSEDSFWPSELILKTTVTFVLLNQIANCQQMNSFQIKTFDLKRVHLLTVVCNLDNYNSNYTVSGKKLPVYTFASNFAKC